MPPIRPAGVGSTCSASRSCGPAPSLASADSEPFRSTDTVTSNVPGPPGRPESPEVYTYGDVVIVEPLTFTPMTAPGNDVLLTVLLVAFTASTGYAAGRIHQWYRTALERDQA